MPSETERTTEQAGASEGQRDLRRSNRSPASIAASNSSTPPLTRSSTHRRASSRSPSAAPAAEPAGAPPATAATTSATSAARAATSAATTGPARVLRGRLLLVRQPGPGPVQAAHGPPGLLLRLLPDRQAELTSSGAISTGIHRSGSRDERGPSISGSLRRRAARARTTSGWPVGTPPPSDDGLCGPNGHHARSPSGAGRIDSLSWDTDAWTGRFTVPRSTLMTRAVTRARTACPPARRKAP